MILEHGKMSLKKSVFSKVILWQIQELDHFFRQMVACFLGDKTDF